MALPSTYKDEMISSDNKIIVLNKGKTIKHCGSIILNPQVRTAVPLSFIAQYGYDPDLVFDYSPYKDQMKTRDDNGRFTFDWWCPLSMIDGYGRHAISIYQGFQDLGTTPNLRTDGWGVDRLYLPPDVDNARHSTMQRLPSKVSAMMTLPYHPFETQSFAKIIITQFETNHIPEKHVYNVNQFDHLIVTSSFQPKIWKESGCRIPISVMTPGVDTDIFTYKERPKTGKFKVLMLGALTGRKNPLGAIRIFQRASEGNPDWRLCIKTRNADGMDGVRKVAALDPRIEVVTSDIHPMQVVKYYHNFDVLLWPSKGEGCGLPPLEALSTGMEVVCSQNSGMLDFIDENHCYPIRTDRMEPANIPGIGFSLQYTLNYGSVGQWWVPDEDHGVSQLKKCFDNWYNGRGKGKKAAEYVRAHHTLKQQAASVLKVLLKYE